MTGTSGPSRRANKLSILPCVGWLNRRLSLSHSQRFTFPHPSMPLPAIAESSRHGVGEAGVPCLVNVSVFLTYSMVVFPFMTPHAGRDERKGINPKHQGSWPHILGARGSLCRRRCGLSDARHIPHGLCSSMNLYRSQSLPFINYNSVPYG
jgi:hypothetical protein